MNRREALRTAAAAIVVPFCGVNIADAHGWHTTAWEWAQTIRMEVVNGRNSYSHSMDVVLRFQFTTNGTEAAVFKWAQADGPIDTAPFEWQEIVRGPAKPIRQLAHNIGMPH